MSDFSTVRDNPYQPPKLEALGTGDRTRAHLTFVVMAWTLWIGLALSFLWDLMEMIFQGPSEPQPLGKTRLVTLVLIASVQVGMVLFMRWVIFRLVMRRVSPSSWTGAIRCIVGALVVYGMIKLLETAGFRLRADSGDWRPFLIFVGPAILLAALFVPIRLVDYITAGKRKLLI